MERTNRASRSLYRNNCTRGGCAGHSDAVSAAVLPATLLPVNQPWRRVSHLQGAYLPVEKPLPLAGRISCGLSWA